MHSSDSDKLKATESVEAASSGLALFLQQFGERPIDEEPLQALFEKVERAKQEWEATADALPELICLLDDRGRILRANRAVEDWELSSVRDVRDRDLHAVMHPECPAGTCYLERMLNRLSFETDERKASEIEVYDELLKRHLRIQLRPMPTHKRPGSSVAAFVVQDITQRKQAEMALRRHTERLETMNEIGEAILAACAPSDIAQAALGRLRHLVPFCQARVTLWMPDTDEFVVMAAYVNGATHLRPGVAYPASDFRSGDDRRPNQHVRIDDLTELADLSALERQLVREDIRAYLSTPLIAEGSFIGTLSLGSDREATFDSEHEAIVYQLADLLAIAIRQAQLFEKLNRTNEQLQTALQAKDRMIQNVSHELRSPLSLISGYTDLLESADLGPLTPEQTRAVQVMRHQETNLLRMVERLLALQMINDEALNKDMLNLGAWLEGIVQSWAARAEKSGIALALDLPADLPPILVDAEVLEHVVENLLDNAFKFSPDGGPVCVRVRRAAGQVIVAVSDSGIGIAADNLPKVLERFYQVDDFTSRRFRGMGVGLALCKVIVEAHGGRIWAESRGEGRGSTFCFTLPATLGAADGRESVERVA